MTLKSSGCHYIAYVMEYSVPYYLKATAIDVRVRVRVRVGVGIRSVPCYLNEAVKT